MHSDFRVIVHSGHVSSLAMKARHKAFARCNKKFRGENIPFPAFSSIFCLGDGWFTLTFVLNVLVYFPSFLFFDLKNGLARQNSFGNRLVIIWCPSKKSSPKLRFHQHQHVIHISHPSYLCPN